MGYDMYWVQQDPQDSESGYFRWMRAAAAHGGFEVR
jgi:hypothetical protein